MKLLIISVALAALSTVSTLYAIPRKPSSSTVNLAHVPARKGPSLWGNLERGPFDVGLRVTTLLDRSRRETVHARGRPIELTLWYPASPKSGAPRLTIGDYLKLSDISREASAQTTRGIAASLRPVLAEAMTADPKGVSDSLLDSVLATSMLAVRDAAPLKKRFPLVLWSARHGTALAQSVLCEYLASHGYVVAYARYSGAHLPLPYEAKTSEEKARTLAAHVDDLHFALAGLQKLENVAAKKICVIAWSYAGESATLLQIRNRDVRLVIGLSSNVLENWVYQPPGALTSLDPKRLRVPYVLMTERVSTNGSLRNPPAILDAMPAESYFVVFKELAHGNFNAIEGMIPSLLKIENVPRWSKAGPVAQLGYETIARYNLRFLDHYLKSKNADPLNQSNAGATLPAGFVTITRHGPKNQRGR